MSCKDCTFSTKKPAGKVSCSKHPEKGGAFKPIDDCEDYNSLEPISGSPPETKSEIIPVSGNVPVSRTPKLIAAEINDIKLRTRKMMLYNSIEIGRRLVEAKSLIDHGDWGDWLERSVDYSKSTANNLMRIFEEYGADQMTLLLDSNAKNEAFGNLSYTQAVALLGLPEGEREDFIANNDLDSMSTRELQQAVKERDQALQEKNDIASELDKLQEEKDANMQRIKELEEEKNNSGQRIQELTKKLEDTTLDPESKESLQKQLDAEKQFSSEKEKELAEKDKQLQKLKKDMDGEISKSKKRVNELEKRIKELEEKPAQLAEPSGATEEEKEKIRAEAAAEYEKKLKDLRDEKAQAEKKIKELEIKATQQNPAALKYKVYFEELRQVFENLLGALNEIKATDEEVHGKYKNATAALISKMSECL
jgi:hypothetical protein